MDTIFSGSKTLIQKSASTPMNLIPGLVKGKTTRITLISNLTASLTGTCEEDKSQVILPSGTYDIGFNLKKEFCFKVNCVTFSGVLELSIEDGGIVYELESEFIRSKVVDTIQHSVTGTITVTDVQQSGIVYYPAWEGNVSIPTNNVGAEYSLPGVKPGVQTRYFFAEEYNVTVSSYEGRTLGTVKLLDKGANLASDSSYYKSQSYNVDYGGPGYIATYTPYVDLKITADNKGYFKTGIQNVNGGCWTAELDSQKPASITLLAVDQIPVFNITKTISNATLTIHKNGAEYSGNTVQMGDSLTFSASPASGYKIKSITVTHNGTSQNWTSGTLVVSGNVSVSVSTEVIPGSTYNITKSTSNASIAVLRNGTEYQGDTIQAGDILSFFASPDVGYQITSFKVTHNESLQDWTGGTLTVGGAVNISVSAETLYTNVWSGNTSISTYGYSKEYNLPGVVSGAQTRYIFAEDYVVTVSSYDRRMQETVKLLDKGANVANGSSFYKSQTFNYKNYDVGATATYTPYVDLKIVENNKGMFGAGINVSVDGCWTYDNSQKPSSITLLAIEQVQVFSLTKSSSNATLIVQRNGVTYNGNTIQPGDTLSFSGLPALGYEAASITVTHNGATQNWTGGTLTVVGNVSVNVSAAVIPGSTYSLSKNLSNYASLSVMRNGTVYSGDTVQAGDILSFSASPTAGYKIISFTVTHNGSTQNWTGGTLTVKGAVNISISTEILYIPIWSGSLSIPTNNVGAEYNLPGVKPEIQVKYIFAEEYNITVSSYRGSALGTVKLLDKGVNLSNKDSSYYKSQTYSYNFGGGFIGTYTPFVDLKITADNKGYFKTGVQVVNDGCWTESDSQKPSSITLIGIEQLQPFNLVKSIDANTAITVKRNGTVYTGGLVQIGDVLSFSASPNPGCELTLFKVTHNDITNNWTSGQSLTVGGPVTVTASSVRTVSTVWTGSLSLKNSGTFDISGLQTNKTTIYTFSEGLSVQVNDCQGYSLGTKTLIAAGTRSVANGAVSESVSFYDSLNASTLTIKISINVSSVGKLTSSLSSSGGGGCWYPSPSYSGNLLLTKIEQ